MKSRRMEPSPAPGRRESGKPPHQSTPPLRTSGRHVKKMVVLLMVMATTIWWSRRGAHDSALPITPFSVSPKTASQGSSITRVPTDPANHQTAQGPTQEVKTSTAETMTGKVATRIGRVIIVGGGLAGQSAAIQAARSGASEVVVLEKEARLGGNSAKATSGINGWGTPAQKAADIDDNGELFEKDTFRSGKGGHCQPDLVKTLSDRSADAIKWLSSFDIPLTVLSQLGGASRKRCHRAPDQKDGTPVPIGFTIMKTLENHIRSQLASTVRIETNARLIALIRNGDTENAISGVTYIQKDAAGVEAQVQLLADAVILATGGFSNDHTPNSLLQQYAPQLSNFPTTNGPWATGDGVKAAREVGVALVDMDKVQLHPTGLINPKQPNASTLFLGPEALRGSGGVLLNKNGERFVNELDLRSVVSQAIIEQENVFPESNHRRFAYCVLNEEAADAFGRGALGFYWKKMGLFEKVNDVPALAKLIGCDEATLTATLKQYEQLSSTPSSPCPLTGKTVFPCVLGTQGPFYVAYVTPSIHYTMGGCLISPSAEILTGTDSPHPIPGLFGAGEVTGGVHGGNRLGGNSLLECVVFGKIAGERAAERAIL